MADESQHAPTAGPAPQQPTLADFADVLAEGTSEAWERLAPFLPPDAYLVGGTALAVHLRHRVSRDLDFFTEHTFDSTLLAAALKARFDDFQATKVDDGTVNGRLGVTKIQVLDASGQKRLAAVTSLAGIRIAAVEDILAMKLKVIMDRGELRDYFDLMCIEKATDLDAVAGIHLYLARYSPAVPEQHIYQIVKSLGYLDDVADDPGLHVSRVEIAAYWLKRQTAIENGAGLR